MNAQSPECHVIILSDFGLVQCGGDNVTGYAYVPQRIMVCDRHASDAREAGFKVVEMGA